MKNRPTSGYQDGQISRRGMLLTLPALALAPRAFAQGQSRLRARALNHMTLSVSDVKRSLDFYQGLFGMPIAARQGSTIVLRLGDGPQFVALSPAGSNRPSINHFCITVEDFSVDGVLKTLADHGITRAATGAAGGGLSGGPMKVRVRMRGPDAGGAPQGTPEIYFGDPDNIVVQLQDPSYCGGAGPLGNVCGTPEPSPKKGLMALKGLSHFTISVSDADRSNKFYQDLFGFDIQAHQAASPLLGVGSGVSFVMFTGGAGAARGGGAPRPASINHACMNMENFKPDDVMKALESYGIQDRGAGRGPVGPMRKYISMRMPNRGGAEGGTPELYFSDPDGLLIQLQDVKYCGGGGYLGDVCNG
jgi:catechol 2,3-dioxygenase-like lactoylglutathione lyase family enzyme